MNIISTTDSPILQITDFISPLLCEELLYTLPLTNPSVDSFNRPIITEINSLVVHRHIKDRISPLLQLVNDKYQVNSISYTPPIVNWLSDGVKQHAKQDNVIYDIQNGIWYKKEKNKSFSVIVFLTNSISGTLDTGDVYGGNIKFHSFSYDVIPEMGKMLVIPCAPQFIHSISKILFGNMVFVKFCINTSQEYTYSNDNFSVVSAKWNMINM